jgi:NitT/TauT family transport system substrate-binding protein
MTVKKGHPMIRNENRQRRRSIIRPLAIIAAATLALSACGTPSAAPPGQTGTGGAAQGAGGGPKVIIGAGSSAVAAMEQGQVDAAVMLEPDVSVLTKRIGHDPVLLEDVRTTEGLKEVFDADAWPSASLYAKADWLDQNKETAGKLAKAIKRTLEFIDGHSGEEIAAKMPEKFAGGDKALYAGVIEELKKTLSKDGAFTEDGVQAVLKTQRVANPEVGDKDIQLADTYTNEFVK